MSILQITNGDMAAARLLELDPSSAILPWRDALHEGPVPSGVTLSDLSAVRALFVSSAGWAPYLDAKSMFDARDAILIDHRRFDELGLWFEWDLYDQLQLLQVLDFLIRDGRPLSDITLVNCAGYLGELTVEQLEELTEQFESMGERDARVVLELWDAFRCGDVGRIARYTRSSDAESTALPFMREAMVRLLEELPSTHNGLSRSEQNIMQALSAGPQTVAKLFELAHANVEERKFLGDTVFEMQLERLAVGFYPLVAFEDMQVRRTAHGDTVFRNEVDWIEIAAEERWIGGLQILPQSVACPRWDCATGMVVQKP